MEFHREMAARDGGMRVRQHAAPARRSARRLGLDLDRPAGAGPALRRSHAAPLARLHARRGR